MIGSNFGLTNMGKRDFYMIYLTGVCMRVLEYVCAYVCEEKKY